MKKIGIYVHIPFCVRKCNYCDFYSVKWNNELENKYIDSVVKEIISYKESLSSDYMVDTVYFGGGTPSIVKPESFLKIMKSINKVFKIEESAEISMEANPNTLNKINLPAYRELGINRISIGVQSLKDDILNKLGRLHDSREAIAALKEAEYYGFENINADVMFNIPGQTFKDIEETILKLVKENVSHISFYSLKIEKGTPFYLMEKNHELIMPEDDFEREMYYTGRNIMEKNNLKQYEISNFSKIGYECRHNLKYWRQEEYIGIGPSAHSFLHNKRYSNPGNIDSYIINAENGLFKRDVQEIMDYDDLEFEYIMLNLRLTDGLNINSFNKKFSLDFNRKYEKEVDFLIKNKLLEREDNDEIRLTKRGMDISNYVFQYFMNNR